MKTPTELLKAASADIDAGNLPHAAALAYQAAAQAARATADRLGFPAHDDEALRNLMLTLDGIPPLPDDLYDDSSVSAWLTQNATTPAPYSSGFSIALAFRQHAETPQEHKRAVPELYWQDDQYDWYLQSVARFIKNLSHAKLPENAHGSPEPRDRSRFPLHENPVGNQPR